VNWEPPALIGVVCGTAAIGAAAWYWVSGTWQRTMLLGVLVGLLVYSGVGAADPGVPEAT